MKRFLALLLTVVLVCGVCVLPTQAEAQPKYEKIDTEYPFVLVRGMDFGGLLIAVLAFIGSVGPLHALGHVHHQEKNRDLEEEEDEVSDSY